MRYISKVFHYIAVSRWQMFQVSIAKQETYQTNTFVHKSQVMVSANI